MAAFARHVGQGDIDAGRQPARGFVEHGDFLTSNLGSSEITELMQGGMGFVQPAKDKAAETGLDEKVQRTAVERHGESFRRSS